MTLRTVLGQLLLVTRNANDVISTRDETVGADELLADFAAEALGMPLFASVLVFLHSGSKDVSTKGAAACKPAFVTSGAVQVVVFVGE